MTELCQFNVLAQNSKKKFGGLNQKSAMISMCNIHILNASKTFIEKFRRSRLFGE